MQGGETGGETEGRGKKRQARGGREREEGGRRATKGEEGNSESASWGDQSSFPVLGSRREAECLLPTPKAYILNPFSTGPSGISLDLTF